MGDDDMGGRCGNDGGMHAYGITYIHTYIHTWQAGRQACIRATDGMMGKRRGVGMEGDIGDGDG